MLTGPATLTRAGRAVLRTLEEQLGVPVIGIPHSGAPAIMFGGTVGGPKLPVGIPTGMFDIAPLQYGAPL